MKKYIVATVVLIVAGIVWFATTQGDDDRTDRPLSSSAQEITVYKPPISEGVAEPLTVAVDNLRAKGPLRFALFTATNDFPDRSAAFHKFSVAPSGASIAVAVDGLAEGTYAIAVFQDLNEDGVLNKGKFGIPTEPFGFSNNAMGKFGPPSFDAAAFRYTKGMKQIGIRLP